MRRGHRGENLSHPVTQLISRDSAWHCGSAELRNGLIAVQLTDTIQVVCTVPIRLPDNQPTNETIVKTHKHQYERCLFVFFTAKHKYIK